jgi:hypothetical protein
MADNLFIYEHGKVLAMDLGKEKFNDSTRKILIDQKNLGLLVLEGR